MVNSEFSHRATSIKSKTLDVNREYKVSVDGIENKLSHFERESKYAFNSING